MAHVLAANKRILEKGLCSDLIITAGNGMEIATHKLFLIAHSPVLQRMLEGQLKESKSGRISMDDITEEGVRAFLRFIYHGEVIGKEESIDLIYDVLYAAHKYEVSDLEAIMKTSLLERKDDDFGTSMAFKVYAFVRGIDTAKELKDKMVRIMRLKYGEVKMLPEFKEVFKNPEDAFELCTNLVEVQPPSGGNLDQDDIRSENMMYYPRGLPSQNRGKKWRRRRNDGVVQEDWSASPDSWLSFSNDFS